MFIARIVFYLEHYQPIMVLEDPPLSCEYMSSIIEYMATTIETAYFNNVKQHFFICVERYINVITKKKFQVDQIKKSALTSSQKQEQMAILSRFVRNLKSDILDISKSQLSSDPAYHEFILQTRAAILPNNSSYEHDNVYYDLQCHPEQYLLMYPFHRNFRYKNSS